MCGEDSPHCSKMNRPPAAVRWTVALCAALLAASILACVQLGPPVINIEPQPLPPDHTDAVGLSLTSYTDTNAISDILLDDDGTPAMLFYHNMPNFRSGSLKFLDMTVSQLRWDGSRWQIEEIQNAAPYHRANLKGQAVYACSGAQKPGDIDTAVVMEGRHGEYSGSGFQTIVVPCRAHAVLYRRSEAGWRRIGPVTGAPETWEDPSQPEAFETRVQWIERARGDFELILSRVTRYRAFQDWTSTLIGAAIQGK